RLLAGIVESPQVRVSHIGLLSEAETQEQLAKWKSPAANDACIHSLFEQHAAAKAQAVAVVCGHQHLTYGELNRRANQLAHYLIEQGVRPEARVGVCTERSAAMAIGMLGI